MLAISYTPLGTHTQSYSLIVNFLDEDTTYLVLRKLTSFHHHPCPYWNRLKPQENLYSHRLALNNLIGPYNIGTPSYSIDNDR